MTYQGRPGPSATLSMHSSYEYLLSEQFGPSEEISSASIPPRRAAPTRASRIFLRVMRDTLPELPRA